MTQNDGGPAFPSIAELGDVVTTDGGMSLRDAGSEGQTLKDAWETCERSADLIEDLIAQLSTERATIEAQAAEISRLRAVMTRMHEGWANALELHIIAERHRTSATILRDAARAALVQP